MHYGEKIKQLRDEHGYSQRKLSFTINENHRNINNWEPLQYPPLDFIAKTCEHFNIRLSEFFSTDDDNILTEDRYLIEALHLLPDDIRKDVRKNCQDLVATCLKATGKV